MNEGSCSRPVNLSIHFYLTILQNINSTDPKALPVSDIYFLWFLNNTDMHKNINETTNKPASVNKECRGFKTL